MEKQNKLKLEATKEQLDFLSGVRNKVWEKKYSVTKILDFHLGNPFIELIKSGKITQEQLDFAGLKGSCVHKANELFLNSNEIDKEKLTWKIGTKFINYLKDIEDKQREKIITLINQSLKHLKNESGGLTEKKLEYGSVRGVIDWMKFDLLNLMKNINNNDELEYIYTIHDFKTSSGSITKDSLERIKLQLVAYYWLATNNGYKVSRNAYIDHIKEKNVKVIEFEITDELINKWEDMVDEFIQYQELQQGEK